MFDVCFVIWNAPLSKCIVLMTAFNFLTLNLDPCSFKCHIIDFYSISPTCSKDGEEDLSEEEQILRAIALSLGQDVAAEDTKEQEEAKKKEEEEEKARKEEEEKEKVKRSMEPLDKVLLDDFSDLLLPGCLSLASSVSGSVYRVCDLISALAKRNGEKWRGKALGDVRHAVSWCVKLSVKTQAL